MERIDSDGYPVATPHDPIEEIFPDVFLVRGSYRMNGFMSFNRNMVILRHQNDLTVLNSVRLSTKGETELDALGTVRHVVRLGYFHGQDDAYFVDRYAADFWAPLASRAKPGPAVTQILSEADGLPVPDTQVLLFRHSKHPEAVVLLQRHGGLLLTCDALQNYADRRFCSPVAKLAMPLMGFPLRLIIGPVWLKAMTPDTPSNSSLRPDFERIQALEFQHFVAGHGSLLRDTAKPAVAAAIRDGLPS